MDKRRLPLCCLYFPMISKKKQVFFYRIARQKQLWVAPLEKRQLKRRKRQVLPLSVQKRTQLEKNSKSTG
jgi:hypothetical protein